jgi:hypothetical protein
MKKQRAVIPKIQERPKRKVVTAEEMVERLRQLEAERQEWLRRVKKKISS